MLFEELCKLANISPKRDVETGAEQAWPLKDLRKTCATYYDLHVPESAIEILGHSVQGITYRHYAGRDPFAYRAITTLPQPSAFLSLIKGHDGECPCCRRRF
ncbi:MAG: hypothetical protein ACK56W_15495 [Pirellula sp.]|nr:hypothetical protein [Pirellula sp.]